MSNAAHESCHVALAGGRGKNTGKGKSRGADAKAKAAPVAHK